MDPHKDHLRIKCGDYGKIALGIAATFGHADVVQLLLNVDSSPAHITMKNDQGHTAMWEACENNNRQIEALLLAAGGESLSLTVNKISSMAIIMSIQPVSS